MGEQPLTLSTSVPQSSAGAAIWRAVVYFVLNLPEISLGLLTIGLTLTTLASVGLRYFLQQPLAWADELSRFQFIAMGLIGGAVCVKRRAHINLTIVVARFSPRLQHYLAILSCLSMLGMSILLIVGGFRITEVMSRQISPVLEIPMDRLYVLVPISATLSIVYLIPQLIALLRGESLTPSPHSEHSPAGQSAEPVVAKIGE